MKIRRSRSSMADEQRLSFSAGRRFGTVVPGRLTALDLNNKVAVRFPGALTWHCFFSVLLIVRTHLTAVNRIFYLLESHSLMVVIAFE
jgi:hypothetical protein